jgi:hypothetical protein
MSLLILTIYPRADLGNVKTLNNANQHGGDFVMKVKIDCTGQQWVGVAEVVVVVMCTGRRRR